MLELREYIIKHVARGACTCGSCADAQKHPEECQPTGHTSDVEFFQVKLEDSPDPKTLRDLIKSHKGVFCEADLFDGNEHGYIEIGGWIGDQTLALMLMGAGELLELWQLHTPTSMGMPEDVRMMLAQNGMVSIISKEGT
jgi:hypothetical protein